MKSILSKCALFLLLVAVAACGKTPTTSATENEAVLAVVRNQMDALNREDIAGAMAAVDSQSPAFAKSKEMTEQLFKLYDLRYTLKSVSVESINGDEARVRFDQETVKVSGPDFKDNRVEGVHTLKKRADGWKIAGTTADKVSYTK